MNEVFKFLPYLPFVEHSLVRETFFYVKRAVLLVHFNFAFCMKISFEFFLNEKRKKNRFSDKLLHRPMSNIEVDMQVTIFWKKEVSFVAFGI